MLCLCSEDVKQTAELLGNRDMAKSMYFLVKTVIYE